MHPTVFQLGAAAAAIATVVAWLSVRSARLNTPSWSVRFWMFVVDFPFFGRLALYRRGRRTFPRREAFVAAWFVTFCMAMLIGVWIANLIR